MKQNVTLTLMSLLSLLFLMFHFTHDVIRQAAGANTYPIPVLVFALWLYATLMLSGRIGGYVIMFLGGLAALGMPIIHRNNGFTAAVARSPGGLFFIWTLIALGVTGGLAMILSARGLWKLRSRKT